MSGDYTAAFTLTSFALALLMVRLLRQALLTLSSTSCSLKSLQGSRFYGRMPVKFLLLTAHHYKHRMALIRVLCLKLTSAVCRCFGPTRRMTGKRQPLRLVSIFRNPLFTHPTMWICSACSKPLAKAITKKLFYKVI